MTRLAREIGIDNLRVDDIPDVLHTSVECGLCLWSPEAYRAELCREDSIMLKAVTYDGRFAGFAVGRTFEVGADRHVVELTNIGVAKAFQKQGFGHRLLRTFIRRCIEMGTDAIVLEVRVSNVTAILFYQRFGFARMGRRKGFYNGPSEDALTMQLLL
jgi:ribosomal-protein-alanine N-acetyltransferase